jgi:hypothetical protein
LHLLSLSRGQWRSRRSQLRRVRNKVEVMTTQVRGMSSRWPQLQEMSKRQAGLQRVPLVVWSSRRRGSSSRALASLCPSRFTMSNSQQRRQRMGSCCPLT